MSASQFVERVQGINLPLGDLCERAGVARSTLHRWMRRGDAAMHVDTIRRLHDALLAAELDMLAHLVEVHGVPAEPRVEEAA